MEVRECFNCGLIYENLDIAQCEHCKSTHLIIANKYKICPHCNKKLGSSIPQCIDGMDLSSQPIHYSLGNNSEEDNDTLEEKKQSIKLVSLQDGFEICIPSSGGLLGRAGIFEPEYFLEKDTVSRKHAILRYDENEDCFYIVDKESSNFTYVNKKKIKPEVQVKIEVGDIIRFAEYNFEVK